MTTRIFVLAGLVLSAACESSEAKFDRAASTARSEIVEQIRRGIEATRTKNVDAYLDQLPDDVPMTGPDGQRMTTDALREQIRTAWESIDTTRALDVIIDTVVYHGDSATVLTTTRWDRLVIRPEGGVIDTVLSVKKQSETWRTTPKGWRAYQVHTIGTTLTVNGQPVLPGGG